MAARVIQLHPGTAAAPGWKGAALGGGLATCDALPVVTFPDGTRAAVAPVPSLLALQLGHTYVRVHQPAEDAPSRVTGSGTLRRIQRRGGRFWLAFTCEGWPWRVPYDAPGYTWYAVAYELGPRLTQGVRA